MRFLQAKCYRSTSFDAKTWTLAWLTRADVLPTKLMPACASAGLLFPKADCSMPALLDAADEGRHLSLYF